MLPRNCSATCELGEMLYIFKFKYGECFQLVDTSDFGIFFTNDYTNVKNFSKIIQYCSFMLQIKRNNFVANPSSNVSKYKRFGLKT